MPTRYDVDPDGAWLVPFARKKLAQLKEQCTDFGVDYLQRTYQADADTRITVATVGGFDKITIRATGIPPNHLVVGGGTTSVNSFALRTVVATTPWYDRVTGVHLAALDGRLSFKPDNGYEGLPVTLAPAIKATYITRLREAVVARRPEARYWLTALHANTIRWRGVFFTLSTAEARVSEADANGKFYMLLGRWETERNVDGSFVAADPSAPRIENFVGLSVSIDDYERVRVGRLVDFDAPPDDETYEGPTLYGPLWSGGLLVATGATYQRSELGTFPRERHYRPDVLAVSAANPEASAWAVPLFSRVWTGDASSAELTWEFKLHKLSAVGAPVVEDLPLPAVTAEHVSVGTVPTADQAVTSSGWGADYVFFDGERLRKIGTFSRTASIDAFAEVGDGPDVEGVELRVASVPVPPSFAFDVYQPHYSFVVHRGASLVVDESDFGVGAFTSATRRGSALPPVSLGPSEGPVWGSATLYGRTERGFAVAGFSGTDSVAVSSGTPAQSTGTISISARLFAGVPGCIWYRGADKDVGVFMFDPLSTYSAFSSDCIKYRNVYLEEVGYRRVVNADGSTTDEAGYEDPEVILQRLWDGITVYVNNFASPALVPWLGESAGLVIV